MYMERRIPTNCATNQSQNLLQGVFTPHPLTLSAPQEHVHKPYNYIPYIRQTMNQASHLGCRIPFPLEFGLCLRQEGLNCRKKQIKLIRLSNTAN